MNAIIKRNMGKILFDTEYLETTNFADNLNKQMH